MSADGPLRTPVRTPTSGGSGGNTTSSGDSSPHMNMDDFHKYVIRDLDTGEVYALGADDLEFDTFTSPRTPKRKSSYSEQMLKGMGEAVSSVSDGISSTVSGMIAWFSDSSVLWGGADDPMGLNGAAVRHETSRMHGDDGRPGEEIRMTDLGVVKTLGRGAFGQVLLVRHKVSQRQFALKIVRLQATGHITQNQLLEEKEVLEKMGRCRHPYCAALRFAFHTHESLYLGMEYLPGGDLKSHLRLHRRLPVEWVRFWGAELVLALGHLHSLDIVYRDVKPHNCILDSEGHVRIVDFGLSKQKVTDACGARTLLGTPDYAAPEVLAVGFRRAAMKRERRQAKSADCGSNRRKSAREISLDDLQLWRDGYGKAADWWSLGVMIFELIGGVPPFQTRDIRQTYKRILFSTLKFRPEGAFDEATRQLLTGLLEKDPADRLGSWSDIPKDIMSQPFFEGIDWDALMARKLPSPFFISQDASSASLPEEPMEAPAAPAPPLPTAAPPGETTPTTSSVHGQKGPGQGGALGAAAASLDEAF